MIEFLGLEGSGLDGGHLILFAALVAVAVVVQLQAWRKLFRGSERVLGADEGARGAPDIEDRPPVPDFEVRLFYFRQEDDDPTPKLRALFLDGFTVGGSAAFPDGTVVWLLVRKTWRPPL